MEDGDEAMQKNGFDEIVALLCTHVGTYGIRKLVIPISRCNFFWHDFMHR